jgi:small subunit ribosomal protein S20
MANTTSAIKAARQALRRQDRNNIVKSRLKTLSRKLAKLTTEGKTDEARVVAVDFISALDKASKSNVVHKNVVARQKSKLSKLVLVKATA